MLKPILEILRRAYQWQALSLRGLLTLVLATFILRQYAFPESDLLADILGKTLLTLTLATLAVGFIFKLFLQRQLSVEANFDSSNPRSKTPLGAGLILKNNSRYALSVPAGFSLKIVRVFTKPGVTLSVHIVRGQIPSLSKRYLMDSLSFPHRANWELCSVRCSLEDILGLTHFSWELPLHSALEVRAPLIPISPLPLLAASTVLGDQNTDITERSGELFDIKAYDPSDGAKRILWKTYAKSGELMVRRPEPAVVPEGELAIFVMASRKEDFVIGCLSSYLEFLSNQNIRVILGVDALEELSGDPAPQQSFVNDPLKFQPLLNTRVWDSEIAQGKRLENYLSAVQGSGRNILQLLIFASADNRFLPEVLKVCQTRQIRPCLALVDKTALQVPAFKKDSVKQKLPGWRKHQAPSTVNRGLAPAYLQQAGADILEVEPALRS